MAVLISVVGNSAVTVVVGTTAVLTGQLSIGWSNDVIDARRDLSVGRSDKPVALGGVSAAAVWTAAAVAAVLTVPLSLALGWWAGVVHLVGVVCGWAYNLCLKSTVLSPLPFFVAFGSLPAVATLALPAGPWPPAWALLAGGMIGVAAHFGNVLPDLDEDLATGVVGLPHRLGRVRSTTVATTSGVVAALLVAVASHHTASVATVLLASAAVASAVTGLVAVRRDPRSEAAFFATMAIAALVVALLATSDALV